MGVDTLGILAHVGVLTSMHAHAIFSAASVKESLGDNDQLARMSRSLHGARPAWASINAAIAGNASVTRSPQLLIREAETFNASLSKLTLTPDGGWLAPERILGDWHRTAEVVALATHIAHRLPDLSRSTTAIADQLDRSGVLLMPTRERDDIDHAYRWAALSAERRHAIRSAIADTNRAACHVIAVTRNDAPMADLTATVARMPLRSRDTTQRHTTVPTARSPKSVMY